MADCRAREREGGREGEEREWTEREREGEEERKGEREGEEDRNGVMELTYLYVLFLIFSLHPFL